MSIVKSLSVGNGDMFYIKHNVDSFTILDCCLSDENAVQIVKELQSKSADKGIRRFISTHPDDDHIRGITYLRKQMPIVNFYCVENEATKEDETEDFRQYCALREDPKAFYLVKGSSRRWLNESDEERKGAGIRILWPITTNEHYQEALARTKEGDNPNNLCPIVQYGVQDGVAIVWMGDLETEFMDKIEDAIETPRVHVLFAPHHGRDSGKVPAHWLEQMRPELIVLGEAPSEDMNYYAGYNTLTQNSAGDITFDCVEGEVHIYVSNKSYSVDFLDDEHMSNNHGGYYVGTLKLGG